MFTIHKNFVGGNIAVKEQRDDFVLLENEWRDNLQEWWYWAFCVEGAANQTVTFAFDRDWRVGYYGPAVSHDLKEWHWLDSVEGESFTYHFGPHENCVYFAHNLLYHPQRFYQFAEKNGLTVKELCKSRRGRSVPYFEWGDGDLTVLLTARHHACESTGSYVLEGCLEQLLKDPAPNTKIFCVPFVDFDGVLDGDQGKFRAPHDHNLDYAEDEDPLFPETAAIRSYVAKHGCHYMFDFHSPSHKTKQNDVCFIVQHSMEKMPQLNRFGEIFESCITEQSVPYHHANDFEPNRTWNRTDEPLGTITHINRPENRIALTLETTYFGIDENKVTMDRMVELGRCFAKAFKQYEG